MKLLKNSFNYMIAPAAYRNGLSLYKKKHWGAALNAFKTAHQAAPNNPQIAFKLGVCHLKLKSLHEAHFYISRALELAPYNTQWQIQLAQCNKQLGFSSYELNAAGKPTVAVPRVLQGGFQQSLNISLKKKLLLLPSDYNHRVMADIEPFIAYYQNEFDVYVILRQLDEDVVYKPSHTLVKNGTSYGEYLKLTADYVIDAGSMNYGYRITDTTKWVSVWHGIPYKKMFVDLDIKHLTGAIRYGLAYDSMVSMSDFYTQTFLRKAMRYEGEVLQVGSAKIDKLLDSRSNQQRLSELYQTIGLPHDKKIALYAPEYRADKPFEVTFDTQKLLEVLGEEYCLVVLLPAAHLHAPQQTQNRVYYTKNIGKNDALLLADILISDYNPLMYQFDQYNRPVALFIHDHAEFAKAHPARQQELRIIKRRQYTATTENALLALDWRQIERQNSKFNTPEYIDLAYLKHTLGIPSGKKIVLYAPTFRQAGAMPLPFDAGRLLADLGDDYMLITKLHYLNHLDQHHDNVIDCTSSSDMADLMKIADILISDYSSLVLDFALLNKPIVLFQYDYAEYMQKRGVYFDFADYLPSEQIIRSEEELYQINWQTINADNSKIISTFYPQEDGNATKRIADGIGFIPEIRRGKDIIFLVNDLNQIGGVHSFLKNMAKYYKQTYNSRIFVLAIKEFAEANSELHVLESPYIDFAISSQYLNGACTHILKNTDGIVISLQFSAHMHFQRYLENAKSVLMFHGDVKDMISREMYGPHLSWLNEGKLYNYRKLLLLTKSAVELLRPHLNEDIQPKLGFMHNSIDADYTPIAPSKPLHTAVISRLDADKNIFALIDLGNAIKAAKENITVNIYGDGALKSDFVQAVADNGLEDILLVHGFESDKQKIFSRNDSLLLMSKSEGFPLVLLEAYACGKPVIVFDSFTAAKDLVIDGQTGYLLPYGDYQGVIAAVKQVSHIEQTNVKAMFDRFSNQSVFAEWDKLIGELDEL
ncbi:CDP-glycerol glycerophosphotransferase family protein [Neisseria animalis]|uniref:Glycosyltransferase n=1 Tax=Neisseria animalis TaxID=492 RepID=A0A5P3MS94_NEIAN|nr:CDP-glycerol glycerophosphotransferase family protein [Neisseria animalis]QEY24486.1 glycosyltransferase [Neisseria animalis]ROW33095.1 glycosyltransferase [Neisseria animalis]VEE07168.1 putative glycosyltransferase [Neisseria animalis]